MVGYGAGQALRFASTLILARKLLSPQAFGMVALTTVFLSGLELLSDFGIGTDVVQHRRGDEPSFINTAFTIQVIRSSILFVVALAIAPAFARFYQQPAISILAIVASFSVVARGLASSSLWTMTRHVQLGRLTAITFVSDFAGFVVSVLWALVAPNAWALVVGKMAAVIVLAIVSHAVAEQPVRLTWEPQAAREILAFGLGMLLSSATYFLGGEAERLVIGKFITVSELGCFSLALTIAAAPSQVLQKVANQVFLPMIARSKRDDTARLAKDYSRARLIFFSSSLVIGWFFIAYSHRLVSFLLPPKFEMAGWMLQLLGFRAAQEILSAPASNLILACGASKYSALANGVRLVLMVFGVSLSFSHFGTRSAVAVLAFVPAITYLMVFPGIYRYLRPALKGEIGLFAVFCLLMYGSTVVPWPFA